MRRAASTLGQEITFYEVENAKHDIFLSKASVREKAFNLMFRWLKHLEDDWIISIKT
jgi:alpha-beta hydrolase superfamily lysophospholipase